MIDAGKKNQRITVQRRSGEAQNDLGEQTDPFADLASMWAQAEPLRGREFFAVGQMQRSVDVRFRVDFREDLLETDRILWRGVPHEIVSIIDVDGARHELEIMAQSGVRDGR